MNGECEMRKRMRKPLAFLLTLLMLVSVMGSSALAEDTSPTGTAAAQEDETGTQADTGVTENEEDAENQISAQEAGGSEADLTEYIPSEQPEGVSVKAYATQGVLPEGATLTVKKLEESDPTGQYAEAEQALQDSAVEYDGFLAMDISFLDADGNEIEPEADKVRVEMEVDSTVLPEGAEASTIAVQHLAETEEGISVETVADAADAAEGTVEVSDEKMKAEFSVESFSTFTITYGVWRSKTVHLIDTQGNEIQGNGSLGSESLYTYNGWQAIEDVAETYINQAVNDGYTYEGAYIGTSANPQQTPFQWIKVRQTGNGWSTSYELRYSNNDSKPGSGDNGDDISNNEIYLVFSQQGGGSQPGGDDTPADITPGYRKYVAANGDGTFNLTLDVTGGISSTTQKALVDVVFVLDVSGSMDDKISQNSRTTKLQSARSAINTMVTSLSGNKDIDARYALVTFSGNWGYETYDDASVARSWTQNVNQFTSALNGTNADGGTNYEAGLREANTLLGSKRANASTVVVFVSDGNPTFYYNDQGYTAGNGGSYDATAMSHAQAQVGAMSANFFFTVGVGKESEYDRLENLKDSASEGTTTGYYEGTNEGALQAAFDDIESKITYYRFSNVEITDVLSENVSLTENSTLQITVKNKEGKTVISGDDSVTFSSGEQQDEVTLTASYDSALKQITLNFPDNYELEDGWTYQVTAQIEPTEKAYENYRNNGNAYPDTGADNTDVPGLEESVWISSGKGGVYTNEAKSAILEYTYNGESKTAEYPMPVIPLNPGTLVIEKTITGLEEDAEALETLVRQLEFTYSLNSGTASAVSLDDFTKGENGVYRYEIAGLSPNTSYAVNEQNADLEGSGYRLTENSETEEETGTVAGGGSATAAFINDYEPAQRTLTIAKTVGGNMGDKDKDFTFTLSLEKNGSAYTEAIAYTKGETTEALTAENGAYSFTLRHGESIVLTLPYGCEYTVTEANGNYDVTITPEGGTPIESHVLTGTLTENTEAAFLNELDVNTPTGLFRTIAPYVIMTGTALGAILLFILRRRRLS